MWTLVDDYGEPVIVLLDGQVVLRAVLEHVRWLQAKGHTIQIDDDTAVRIAPDVPHDTWYVLDSNWRDVEALLDADSQDSSPRWTMPGPLTIH
jgi:hypothetical protein